MKQNLADLTFGLHPKILTVLNILSLKEPTFADFDNTSQMFRVRFRSEVFYQDGFEPQVNLIMYPGLTPQGNCSVLTIGVAPDGKISVIRWGATYLGTWDYAHKPDGDYFNRSFFEDPAYAVNCIVNALKEDYEMLTFVETAPQAPTRLEAALLDD